jgi:hypothetical protein
VFVPPNFYILAECFRVRPGTDPKWKNMKGRLQSHSYS